jgi:hypothetical protein
LLGRIINDDISEVEEIIQRNVNDVGSWSILQRAQLLQIEGYMHFMLGDQAHAETAIRKWIDVKRTGYRLDLEVRFFFFNTSLIFMFEPF